MASQHLHRVAIGVYPTRTWLAATNGGPYPLHLHSIIADSCCYIEHSIPSSNFLAYSPFLPPLPAAPSWYRSYQQCEPSRHERDPTHRSKLTVLLVLREGDNIA
eukprot:scaffold296863_cov40-Tisochrysis_lutea.AAC.2